MMNTPGGYPARATAETSASTSGVSASAATRRPAVRAAALVSRSDRHHRDIPAGGRQRASRRRRRDDGEVGRDRGACRRRTAAVQGDDVGAELVREQPTRTLGAGEEHPACRAWDLGQQPLLRRDAGDQVGPAPRRRGRRPDRRHARGPAAGPPFQLARSGRARQHQPVVAVQIDRPGLDRLDLDQRPDDHPVPEPRAAAPRAARSALRGASGRSCGEPCQLLPERARVVARPPLDPAAVLVGDEPDEHGAVVVRGDGRQTPTADRGHARPFRLHPPAGLRIVCGGDELLLARPGPGAPARPVRPPAAALPGRSGGRSPRPARGGRARRRRGRPRRARARRACAGGCRYCREAARSTGSARARAAAPGVGPRRCRRAFPDGARSPRRARHEDRPGPGRRRRRDRQRPSRSCPSRSGPRRRYGRRAAPPPAP